MFRIGVIDVPLATYKSSLPKFRGPIETISQVESWFVRDTSIFPHELTDEDPSHSSKDDYEFVLQASDSLYHQASADGLFHNNTVDVMKRAILGELKTLSHDELDILLHTYLASIKGAILTLIDLNKREQSFGIATKIALREISKHLSVVQHALQILSINRGDESPFRSRVEAMETLSERLGLPDNKKKLHYLDDKDLYELARFSLANAQAGAQETYKANVGSSPRIISVLLAIANGTIAAKRLLDVEIFKRKNPTD